MSGGSDTFGAVLEAYWSRLEREPPSHGPGALLTAQLEILVGNAPIRVGIDGDGKRHLLVPLDADDDLQDDRRSAGVHLVSRRLDGDDGLRRYADLVCQRKDLSEVFTALVSTVCAKAAIATGAGLHIADLLRSWRLLIGGSPHHWTKQRLAGLFAELLVLEQLSAVASNAVESWEGPLGGPQDFRRAKRAIEVKATTAPATRRVRIHGVDQLDAPAEGRLDLVWFGLDSSPDLGRTVLDVLAACRERCDPEELDVRMLALGLSDEPDAPAATTRFTVIEERWYRVDKTFPRVVPASFVSSAVPVGVSGMEYVIDLDHAVSRVERADVLGYWAEGQ